MNFMFEWKKRYLTSERSERVRCRFCHEDFHYHILVLEFLENLLYKRTNYDVFDDFPKISENFQNVVRRLYECFRTFSENFRSFPKIAEDCRRLPRKIRRFFDLISIYFGSFSIGTWQTLQADWSKMISHMCGYHFYPHMWDTIFLDLLPLAIPLQFI